MADLKGVKNIAKAGRLLDNTNRGRRQGVHRKEQCLGNRGINKWWNKKR